MRGLDLDPSPEAPWDVRPSHQRSRPENGDLDVVEGVESAERSPCERALVRIPLEDEPAAVLPRVEELRVHTDRKQPVLAGEAL